MSDRYVIVAEWDDGPYAIGPKPNRTYPNSEVARKDADAIADTCESIEVVRILGIEEL